MIRAAIAAAVLAGVATPAPAHADNLEHVHASQLWHRPRPLLAGEFRRFEAADIVTWTEVGSRAAVLRRRAGWDTFARPGRTDVAVSWQAAEFRPLAGWVRRLTVRRYYTRAGDPAPLQRGAFVVLERTDGLRVLAAVAHMPAHVQLGDMFRLGVPYRVRVWRSAVAGFARQVDAARRRWSADLVIVAADWNVDMRRPVWRHYVLERFTGLRLTWRPPLPRAGTHRGGRLIDATLTDGAGRARLLARTPASDHRPYLDRLRPAA